MSFLIFAAEQVDELAALHERGKRGYRQRFRRRMAIRAQIIEEGFGDEAFRTVLQDPPAGVFDGPSWIYWHNVFGLRPVPELPKRKLC